MPEGARLTGRRESPRIRVPSRRISGHSSAWLERTVRDREVGGSNPLAPTTSLPPPRLSSVSLSLRLSSPSLRRVTNVIPRNAPRHHPVANETQSQLG